MPFDFDNLTHGTVFAERYEIIRELGRGGNSRVYLALDKASESAGAFAVALKVCLQGKGDKKFIPRFLREAFQLSRLDHPNIMKLVDFGNQGGVYYMATEFVNGLSLREHLKAGPVNEETAVVIGRELGRAFAHMKSLSVIHRDVKPDNILVSEDDGRVILVDFGLAKEEGQKTISTGDEFYGTPHFLAPEYIANSDDLTIKVDIYSLGMTLYHAVSGTLPFDAKTPVETIRRQMTEHPPNLTEVSSGITADFAYVVDRMVEKDPAARMSLEEMTRSFQALSAKYA